VWVLAALADLCGMGRHLIPEIAEALKYQDRYATVLRTLAQNFDVDDDLHKCLLTALATETARWGLTA